jgi:hypothetical protein
MAALTLAALSGTARAVTSVNLDFNGTGTTVGATGFDAAYNFDPTGVTLGGGTLQLKTLPGDTFGQYEGNAGAPDPDTARNVFYSVIEPLGRTQVDARVSYTNLVSGFAGGGIWMGTDTDHYIRLGVFRNGPDINVEALRENQDLWPANTQVGSPALPGGPGNDITGIQNTIGSFPAATPFNVDLRIVRTGNTAEAFYSLNGGTTYTAVDRDPGTPGIQSVFDAVSFDSRNLGVPASSVSSVEAPGTYKVGVYAFNGPSDSAGQGTDAFDSFSAVSTPEPGAAVLATLALAGPLATRRRVNR